LNFISKLPEINAKAPNGASVHSATLIHEPEQNVFCASRIAVKSLGLLLGQEHQYERSVGEAS
jgi:hypothetical protein